MFAPFLQHTQTSPRKANMQQLDWQRNNDTAAGRLQLPTALGLSLIPGSENVPMDNALTDKPSLPLNRHQHYSPAATLSIQSVKRSDGKHLALLTLWVLKQGKRGACLKAANSSAVCPWIENSQTEMHMSKRKIHSSYKLLYWNIWLGPNNLSNAMTPHLEHEQQYR